MEDILAVILAGGLGTRISEETQSKPKPMVEIGSKPIIWHLLQVLALQGVKKFAIATGYMSQVIDKWVEESQENGNFIFEDRENLVNVSKVNNIDIKSIETGKDSLTGFRISKIMDRFPNQKILVTYGDGLANINVKRLIDFHNSSGKLATVTAVHPPARFGYLKIENSGMVSSFGEKLQTNSGWINGGFFILEPGVREYILGNESFEESVLPRLVIKNQLQAYKHDDFWLPMDTLREKHDLEKLLDFKPRPWLRNIRQ